MKDDKVKCDYRVQPYLFAVDDVIVDLSTLHIICIGGKHPNFNCSLLILSTLCGTISHANNYSKLSC